MQLSEIYDIYGAMIYRLAFNYTKNTADAEDILQDVLVAYGTKPPRLKNDRAEELKYWLIRVTGNKCINLLKRKRRQELPLDEAVMHSGKDDCAAQSERSDVYSAVLALPLKYREVVFLHYYEGLPVKEIAGLLRQTESAVKVNLHRARQRLKDALGEI